MKLTKAQAIQQFRELYNGAIPKGDAIARREAWSNFTDSLCKDGLITEYQDRTWTNPF